MSTTTSSMARELSAWTPPRLSIHQIDEITKLGFATNCDGGLGLDAIDGDAIFCRRGRRR
jgi:hypothetical protein